MLPIWNLKKYDREGTTMNWAGDSHDSYSVIIDSALGVIGAAPKNKTEFLDEVKWLQQYLREKAPPKFPFPINRPAGGNRQGDLRRQLRGLPRQRQDGEAHALAAVGTDPERIWTWTKDNAVAANKAVRGFGIERKGLVEESLVATTRPSSTGSGSAPPISTTAPCPPCAISSRRPTSAPSSSGAATTSTIR
jgi:hypothetical protein